MAKLTPKQKAFCDEYLIDLNATQAAIRAGYSTDTAKEIGSENLTKPNIRAYIDKEIAERSKRTGINQDRVIRELARIAFVNANDVINIDEATLKDNATQDDTAAIASVKVKTIPTKDGEGVEREIKLTDKLKALELLGKHLGMFKDKVELSVLDTEKNKLDSIINQFKDD
jgi:phage terminase small subunit